MLTEQPTYTLTAPLFISSRLTPAIKVADAVLSAEAHAVESDGRAHFRFTLDVPGVGSWESEDSYVTVMESDWTRAVASALETFTDAAGTDDPSDNAVANDLPETLKTWALDNAIDFFDVAESLREWLGND